MERLSDLLAQGTLSNAREITRLLRVELGEQNNPTRAWNRIWDWLVRSPIGIEPNFAACTAGRGEDEMQTLQDADLARLSELVGQMLSFMLFLGSFAAAHFLDARNKRG
jgi:hypothetical protein